MAEEKITVGDMMDVLERLAQKSMDYEARALRLAARIIHGYAELCSTDPEFHKFLAAKKDAGYIPYA